MKKPGYQVRAMLASVLMLITLMAVGQNKTTNANPGMDAFNAGNFELAQEYWRADAARGDAQAQFNLGYLYTTGKGVEVDHGSALFWYKKAADAGCRAAECSLANRYMHGVGTDQNHDEAIRRYARCVSPGGMCRDQIKTLRELAVNGLKWYADKQYAGAQYELANQALDNGDFSSAIEWLHKAAEQQHGLAQVALGHRYIYGDGVVRNAERGKQLVYSAIVQNRDDEDVLRNAKSTMALAHNGDLIAESSPADKYIWVNLALQDIKDQDSIMGKIYKSSLRDAEVLINSQEYEMTRYRMTRWSELFATGLPGVTEEHLSTMSPPPRD